MTTTLLVDGTQAFPHILQRIHEAKNSIQIVIHIWRDDSIGNEIAQALLAAADRGVTVTIEKDIVGAIFERAEEHKQSMFHKRVDAWTWLQKSVFDAFYRTPGEPRFARQRHNELVAQLHEHPNITITTAYKMDHSKYYLFDNEIAITGGINIEDRTVTADVSGRKWHDYMIEVRGKEHVQQLLRKMQGRKERKKNEKRKIDFHVNKKEKELFEIKEKYLDLINNAQNNITVQAAYMGDKDINNALIARANAGVPTTILVPSRANTQHDFNMHNLKQLLSGSTNITAYLHKNMLHAKMLLVDDKHFTLGSANINKMGMQQVDELNVTITNADKKLIADLQKSISWNKKNSKKITKPEQISYNKVRAWCESWLC